MAPLFIAGGSQVYGRKRLRWHTIGVLLVGLDVGAKFEFDMLVEIEFPTCH